jgi:hypothetical protein
LADEFHDGRKLTLRRLQDKVPAAVQSGGGCSLLPNRGLGEEGGDQNEKGGEANEQSGHLPL